MQLRLSFFFFFFFFSLRLYLTKETDMDYIYSFLNGVETVVIIRYCNEMVKFWEKLRKIRNNLTREMHQKMQFVSLNHYLNEIEIINQENLK